MTNEKMTEFFGVFNLLMKAKIELYKNPNSKSHKEDVRILQHHLDHI